jgi:hypothetical protein
MAVADVLEPLQTLLLQMVFCDECHHLRLENLAIAGIGEPMIQPEVGLSCRSKMRRLMGEGRKPFRR